MKPEHYEGLKDALAHGGGSHTIADVAELIRQGHAQLWTSEGAAIVTEVHDTPQLRRLHFWLATGELPAVIELSEKIIEWGRAQGCHRATLAGRRGWERALGPKWRPELTVMGRDLSVEGSQDDHQPDA